MGCAASRARCKHAEDAPSLTSRRIEDDYNTEGIVGEGSSGPVRLCRHLRTGEVFALKQLRFSSSRSCGTHSSKAQKRTRSEEEVISEVALYSQLDHPYITRLIDVYWQYEAPECAFLVMELARGGDVHRHLLLKGAFTDFEAVNTTKPILDALAYLHSHQIVHRDLKLENWLWHEDGVDAKIKLADFGLATKFTGDAITQRCGSHSYVAPEVQKGRYFNGACDMWSLGVAVFVLLCGYAPFSDGPDKIRDGRFLFKSNINADARNFISALLVTDPAKRPSARECLTHPWLPRRKPLVINDNMYNRLLAFSRFPIMKRCVLQQHVMKCHSLWGEKFLALGSDNRGALSWKEFEQVVPENAQNEEIRQIFDVLAVSGEEIFYSEFVAAVQMPQRAQINLAFVRFDDC
eukprot:GEMP01011071.1.p1 GENE.GEMP01011071.1~~GEMP01011071.1.p1  ORF type:complete len:406 (+),score=69.47 GEMP01011071.1:257-1474(+)